MGVSKKHLMYVYLRVLTQKLGRNFLTRFEIECYLEQKQLYVSNLTQYLENLRMEGFLMAREEDITLGKRLKFYYIK